MPEEHPTVVAVRQSHTNHRRAEVLDRRAVELGNDIAKHSTRLKALHETLAKERLDVERLTAEGIGGLNLTRLFHFLFGDRQEALDREQGEVMAAAAKAEECRSALAGLRSARETTVAERSTLGDTGAALGAAKRSRELAVLQAGGQRATLVSVLSDRLDKHQVEDLEFGEAVEAGTAAIGSLRELYRGLDTAGRWGQRDIMGGGAIVTAIKRGHLNDAQAAARRARQELSAFEREVADTGWVGDLNVDVGLGLADYLLDGLIVDLWVQSGIRSAQAKVAKAQDAMEIAVMELREQRRRGDEARRNLEAERDGLLGLS